MRAIYFEGANNFYEKPKSMTDEECFGISVYEHKDANGKIICITTVWQPNKEDIEAVVAGRPVCIQIFGSALPPHGVFTYDQNGNINE